MSDQTRLERLQQQLENAQTMQEVQLAEAKLDAYRKHRI